jgi:hypothetical protein
MLECRVVESRRVCEPSRRPKRWINGMVFFSSNTADDVVLGWPRSWIRQLAQANRKRRIY